MTTHILIIGSGAVGSYYAGKLSQGGVHVSIWGRSHAHVITENGISIQSPDGDFVFKPKNVYEDLTQVSEEFDYIIVATKVLPEIHLDTLLRSVLTKNTVIVLLQNGIYIEKSIQETFKDHEIISALAFICVTRMTPILIHHQGYGRVMIGTYPNGVSEPCRKLNDLFLKSGVHSKLTEDIQLARWKKMVWNAPFNPISVLTGGKGTQEILDNPLGKELVLEVMKEVQFIASKEGFKIEADFIQKNIRDTEKMVNYKTSMCCDYLAGRPMESDAILGNIFKLADKHKLSLPHIKTLYTLLLSLKKNQRKV